MVIFLEEGDQELERWLQRQKFVKISLYLKNDNEENIMVHDSSFLTVFRS